MFYPSPSNILIPRRKGNLWGFAGLYGNIKIAPRYDDAEPFMDYSNINPGQHYYAVVTAAGEKYIINPAGKIISEGYSLINWRILSFTGEAFIVVTDSGNKEGAFYNGQLTVPPLYDDIMVSDDIYLKVTLNGKTGIISIQNKVIVPVEYDDVYIVTEDGHNLILQWEAVLAAGETTGCEDTPHFYNAPRTVAKEIAGAAFTQALEQVEVKIVPETSVFTIYNTSQAGKGIRFTDERFHIQPVYDDIKPVQQLPFRGENYVPQGWPLFFAVKQNMKYGLIDQTGKFYVPMEMDNIKLVYKPWPCWLVEKSEKQGVFGDEDGHFIYPRYNNIISRNFIVLNEATSFLIYRAELDGLQGYIGENGLEYFEQ